MDLSSSDEELEIVSKEIKEAAKKVTFELLPQKSRQIYTATYNDFKKWRKEKGSNSFCEDVMLAYFGFLAQKYSPSSLWPIYSMLKATINTYNQIDISKYGRLILFIKRKNEGYKQKKSEIFDSDSLSKFLNEAPDEVYLSTKVVVVFGILGGLRRQEFANILISDVIEGKNTLFIKIPNTKNKKPKSFTIADEFYTIVKKYMLLRPHPCSTDRFFIKFANGRCQQQPIGINKFGSMPKDVAHYLNLPNADKFTGHSFRRSSATLLVDGGADITVLMRHGGWESAKVAQGYIGESMANKRKIHDQITSGIILSKKSNISEILENSESSNSAHYGQQTKLPSKPSSKSEILVTKRSHAESAQRTNLSSGTFPKSDILVVGQSQAEIHGLKRSVANTIPIETSTTTFVDNIATITEEDKRTYPVFYHPDTGLYGLESTNDDVSFVLVNCDVKLDSGLHKSIVLNNCNINI